MPVANVSLLTDLMVVNLSAEGLQSVFRALLSSHPEIVSTFNRQARSYLQRQFREMEETMDGDLKIVQDISTIQNLIGALIGSQMTVESLSLVTRVLRACPSLFKKSFGDQERNLSSSMDNDIAQALSLLPAGNSESQVQSLVQEIFSCLEILKPYYPFERTRKTASVLFPGLGGYAKSEKPINSMVWSSNNIGAMETFQIGERRVPRIFCGLWQLSSSAWGSPSFQQIMNAFDAYCQSGFSAFDMADIYGDVEATFGEFYSRVAYPERLFTATKYCTFDGNTEISEQVYKFVSQRLQRLGSDSIDLLQLHWGNYADARYLDVLRVLQDDNRVAHLGLCNFDTKHMELTLQEGIDIKTNQVQFSLIDSRPTVKMAALCDEHDIKLLAYGTLCGGFMSEAWLGRPEPRIFSEEITPSQRKYYDMITAWGGWSLFQELLSTLAAVAKDHNVSIGNVAIRMGISERINDNHATFGWRLDEKDKASIERIQERSQRLEMFNDIGDCGSEHR